MNIVWFFKRRPYLTILDVVGEYYGKANDKIERDMIGTAVELIDIATEFEAKMVCQAPTQKFTSNIAVCFSLIFPNESAINCFVECLESD